MENKPEVISLSLGEQETLEQLSALGYSLREMAMYFKVSYPLFRKEALTKGSDIQYHIERGILTMKANASIQLLSSAESGNITAIQQLTKIQKDREYKDLLLQLEDADE